MSTVKQSKPKIITVGPKDHGRRMALADFEFAEVKEGYTYELGRGAIVVSEVAGFPHLAQIDELRQQLYRYRSVASEAIARIAAGSECKLLIFGFESERHPDVAIYKKPPPRVENPWRRWVPEIVVEVVSRSSRKRDYEEKPDEYLALGVKEYWIVDAQPKEVLVLRRFRGRWSEKIIQPPQLYRTRLLPGFEFDGGAVFAAADQAGA